MRAAGVLMLGLLLVAPGSVADGVAPDLQPRRYSSPSGHYELRIDPSRRSGGGEAKYELRHGDSVVWSGSYEFTLWEAVVTDDGTIGGYGYSHGYNGENHEHGEFIVAIADPDRGVLLQEKVQRQDSRRFHTMADPKGYGVFFNPVSGRMVVRSSTSGSQASEIWQVYDLGRHEPVGTYLDVTLTGEPTASIHEARPVAGTPLTLIYAYRSGMTAGGAEGDAACVASSRMGPVFMLLDAQFEPFWELAFSDEATMASDDERRQVNRAEIYRYGALIDANRPGRFRLRDPVSGERVEYAVEADEAGNWGVRRVSVAPFAESSVSAEPVQSITAPVFELKNLGRIDLERSGTTTYDGPVQDVHEFAADAGGRFGFLVFACQQGGDGISFRVVDDRGNALHDVAIDPATSGDRCSVDTDLAWLHDDQWLVALSNYGAGASIYRIDADAATSTRVLDLESLAIEALAAMRDGGFVALTTAASHHETALSAFDAKGRMRWTVGQSYNDDSKPFSPQDIAVTSEGNVVVLDGSVDKLKIYGDDGVYRTTVDLEQAWGRQPNYVTGLTADTEGGMIVHDFHGKPPIVRMAADGSVRAAFEPRYAHKSSFDISGRVKLGAEGRLWTSDGYAILRLNEAGIVDRVLGAEPDTDSLGTSAAIAVPTKDRIYAVDQRTGAVHVFDGRGRRIHVAKPAVGDYDGEVFDPSLTVSDRGEVFVSRSSTSFVHYSNEGERVGVIKNLLDTTTEEWHSQPGNRNRWVLGYKDIHLVDADGRLLRRVSRTAEGRWLQSPGQAAVAPDGSIAVMSDAVVPGWKRDAPPTVALYSPAGDAIASWPAPAEWMYWTRIAYDGKRLAFMTAPKRDPDAVSVVITDLQGQPLFRMPPVTGRAIARVFLVPSDGATELWLFDGESAIDRYAVP